MGGGIGMICYEFKGGIGIVLCVLVDDVGGWIVGVFV